MPNFDQECHLYCVQGSRQSWCEEKVRVTLGEKNMHATEVGGGRSIAGESRSVFSREERPS